MALNISTNVGSLNAQRHLDASSNSLNKSLERLASGLRINSAADDAAGLANADRLRADVRIATQAVRNANDGISAISIGEKALGKGGEILARLSELASQMLNESGRYQLENCHSINPSRLQVLIDPTYQDPAAINLPAYTNEETWCQRSQRRWDNIRTWCAWSCSEMWSFCR